MSDRFHFSLLASILVHTLAGLALVTTLSRIEVPSLAPQAALSLFPVSFHVENPGGTTGNPALPKLVKRRNFSPPSNRLSSSSERQVSKVAVHERKSVHPLVSTPVKQTSSHSEDSARGAVSFTALQNTRPMSETSGTGQGGSGEIIGGNYRTLIASHLSRVKRYPERALKRRLEGETLLRFELFPTGELKQYKIEKSSAHSLLDEEVLRMVVVAAPFPKAPPNIRGERLEFIVPVRFSLSENT